jgi:hypothetical protein
MLGVLNNLTIGTQYWFDLAYQNAAGSVTIAGPSIGSNFKPSTFQVIELSGAAGATGATGATGAGAVFTVVMGGYYF